MPVQTAHVAPLVMDKTSDTRAIKNTRAISRIRVGIHECSPSAFFPLPGLRVGVVSGVACVIPNANHPRRRANFGRSSASGFWNRLTVSQSEHRPERNTGLVHRVAERAISHNIRGIGIAIARGVGCPNEQRRKRRAVECLGIIADIRQEVSIPQAGTPASGHKEHP